MTEMWKAVNGYDGLYEISSHGRIRRPEHYGPNGHNGMNKYKEKLLKPFKTSTGYWQIGLCKDGRRNNKLIHRLVAEAFIPNPYNYPEVNHIDEDKSNNRVENLQWSSVRHNRSHGSRLQRMVNSRKSYIEIYKDNDLIAIFPSQAKAAELIGTNGSAVSNAIKNGTQLKGFIWRMAK